MIIVQSFTKPGSFTFNFFIPGLVLFTSSLPDPVICVYKIGFDVFVFSFLFLHLQG